MIKNKWKTFYRNVSKRITFSSINIFAPLPGITCRISIIKNYKKVVYNFIMLMVVFGLLIFTGCKSANPDPNPPTPDGGGPITIYYALNESHSNSWVQQSTEGVVGIVYGVFNPGAGIQDGRTTGSLIYKTILPDGSENEEVVATGLGVDKCVLLYDSGSYPHIFYAFSDNSDQIIYHFYRSGGTAWVNETVIGFANEGGRFIYELSADIDKDDAIHLLALKIRSNPDSEDFMNCYQGAYLYHMTNSSGNWEKTLIQRCDTLFTYDMHVKTQRRQDIAVDSEGYVHVVFGEQYATEIGSGPSTMARLYYATNQSSQWVIEPALTSWITTDDSGWWPSLCLDRTGRPAIASTYLARVETKSVRYARLCYSVRSDSGQWATTIIAEIDDGYFGSDGRNYTGALPHLKFDLNNRPHIIFSDIASSHNPKNVLSTGQIRYAVFDGFSWEISTIYRQPSPQAFFQGREMAGQCLVISEDGEKIQVVGQELISTAEDVYTYQLHHFVIK
jgi:hypothetical protein